MYEHFSFNAGGAAPGAPRKVNQRCKWNTLVVSRRGFPVSDRPLGDIPSFACLFLFLSVCSPVCQPVYPFLISICPCLSVCPFVRLPTYLFVYLSLKAKLYYMLHNSEAEEQIMDEGNQDAAYAQPPDNTLNRWNQLSRPLLDNSKTFHSLVSSIGRLW